jgi:predicted Zn-dependent protease
MDVVKEAITTSFGFRVKVLGVRACPREALIPSTGQWDSAVILDHLVEWMPLDSVRIFALAQKDLAQGKAPWSLGMGQPEGKAAVASTYRLASALAEEIRAGEDPDEASARYRLRLYKLLCHELGHTFREFGNIHCPDRECLMNTVEFGLDDIDRLPARYCDRCRVEIETAVRGPVNTEVTYYHLGLYFEERGNLAKAVEAYRKALALNDALARAWNNLGAVLQRMGDPVSAEDAFVEAKGASSEYGLPCLNLGRLQAKGGRPREALGNFEEALRRDKTLTAAWRDGGRLLRDSLGDPRQARRWFSKFLLAGGEDHDVRRWVEERGGILTTGD